MGMTIPEIKALLSKADERELAALERSLAADTRKGVVSALAAARKRIEAEKAENGRIERLYSFERSLAGQHADDAVIVGLDEVGRGSVAGPLAVGAVVLPETPLLKGLNDSKQIKPEKRVEIAQTIRDLAVAWTVFYVQPRDIDRDGMTASLRRAFAGALGQIEAEGIAPDVVLVDGNPLHIDPREISVVKGDASCASIAAASILAKVERDALMTSLASDYPEYGFDVNKGYGVPQHVEAIRTHGLSPLHRTSFCKSYLQETLF